MRDMSETKWRIPLKVLEAVPFVRVNMKWYTKEENQQVIADIEADKERRYQRWKEREFDAYYGCKCPRCDATKNIEETWRDEVKGEHFLFFGSTETKKHTYWHCHNCEHVWSQDGYKDKSFNDAQEAMKNAGFVRMGMIGEKDWKRIRINVDLWGYALMLPAIIGISFLLYSTFFLLPRNLRNIDRSFDRMDRISSATFKMPERSPCSIVLDKVGDVCMSTWGAGQSCQLTGTLAEEYNKCGFGKKE